MNKATEDKVSYNDLVEKWILLEQIQDELSGFGLDAGSYSESYSGAYYDGASAMQCLLINDIKTVEDYINHPDNEWLLECIEEQDLDQI